MKHFKSAMIIGVLFVLITGSLSHFMYDWTNHNTLVGLFTPVSESVWEHMKLLFFPMLLYSLIITCRFRREYPCLGSSLCLGTIAGTLLIPALFYAYTAVLGRNMFVLDIAVFIISILAAFLLSYGFAPSCRLKPYSFLLRILICVFFVCFFRFSYHPPAFPLFKIP